MSEKKPVKKGYARTPVVMQMEALECGAASLCMVLAYYNKWIPLEQVRADCGVSRDGSSARNMLKAARSYGLQAKGFRFEPDVLKEVGQFPCIIHWNFNHFVVLCGFKGKYAMINDPARGSIKIPMEVFDQSFTGVCIMFEPGEDFVPSGKPKSIIGFAKKKLANAKAAFAFVALTTVIISLLGVLTPGFSRIFIDRLLSGKNPEWIMPFIFVLTAVSVTHISIQFINSIYSLKLTGKLAIESNTSFMWHVFHMPMEFFSQRMAGDIQQRQQTNVPIADNLINTFVPMFLNGIMMIFYLVIMLRYSPLLTLIGISAIALDSVASVWISAKRINITRVQMRDQGKLASTTVSGISMIETIKASGAENGFFEKWAGYQAGVNTQTVRYARLNQILGLLPELITQLASLIVLALGIMLTIRGEFSIGMIMAFQGLLVQFTAPAQMTIEAGQEIQELRTDMERIEDIMEYPEDHPFAENTEASKDSYEKLKGLIEFKNVTFGYSPLADPVIRDFSLTIQPGERVALVGTSGCGKSTISKLTSGMIRPWQGEILYDGKPLREIDRDTFKGSLSVVDQDIILFEGTIEENIRLWDNSIEDFEVIMAARDAQIHDDIMERTGGYHHRVLEGGKDFSGGQRQRIEIARVLAGDPTIIILDEATSALDARTEYQVVEAIKARGITCIIVAHRLSTIRDCDQILVLENGVCVEHGTHEELYHAGGAYASLVTNE